MADWTAFGAVAGFVLLLVLGLARVTAATMSGDEEPAASTDDEEPHASTDDEESSAEPTDGTDSTDESASSPQRERPPKQVRDGERTDVQDAEVARGGARVDGEPTPSARDEPSSRANGYGARSDGSTASESNADAIGQRTDVVGPTHDGPQTHRDDDPHLPPISGPALLGNVLVTHGALAAVLAGAAAMTGVPFSTLGVAPDPWSTGLPALLGGVALGLALAAGNAALAANLDRLGIEYSDALRDSLAPDSALDWVLLLGFTLPLVAVFEELLFRAVLVGGVAAGTGLPAWLFVIPSSLAFAAGHGLQGRGGVLVTGGLGAVLAGAFVLTNSLLLVVVAHYVVNAVEFVANELFEADVRERLSV